MTEFTRRNDEDGTPYLAYYRNDLVMGFIWDGCIEHPVQVTREMGEPVIATFDIRIPVGLNLPPGRVLMIFKDRCDAYADSPVSETSDTKGQA